MSHQRLLVLILGLLMAGAAEAHDMWISPSDLAPEVGELVTIALRVGHAGSDDPVPRQDQRILRFSAVGPEGETPLRGLDGKDPAAYWRPQEAGLHALLYESTTAFSELAPETFTHYLQEEGLDAVLELRRQQGAEDRPGRELYSRSLKSLVAVGNADAVIDRAHGLPLEFVLEDARAPGGALALRLLLHGEPLAGALVDIRALGQAMPRFSGRTDQDGRVFPALTPGDWIAATVHMAPTDSPEADWRSLFSTLTFTLGAAEPGASP